MRAPTPTAWTPCTYTTNTPNLPAEALENEYPLLVDEYALVEDSGGAGRQRGGLGIARQIRASRAGNDLLGALRQPYRRRAVGRVRRKGRPPRALVRNPGRADAEELYSKVARIEMKVGDAMRIETPGAGGYGSPAERSVAALAADLKGGKGQPRRG